MGDSAYAQFCRSHLSVILVLGLPVVAAAIHVSSVLGLWYFGPSDMIGGRILLPLNATLAVVGAAVGGFLTKEELIVRLVYALGAAVCSFLAFCVLNCIGILSLTATFSVIAELHTS